MTVRAEQAHPDRVYASRDETLSDWAQRHLEREVAEDNLDALRAAIPQEAPLVQPIGPDLSALAEAFGDANGFDEVAARLSEIPDDLLPLVVPIARIMLARVDAGLPDAAAAVTPETNPPSWVADEATWQQAKEAVRPRWDSYDEPYAVVASVYQTMGGSFK